MNTGLNLVFCLPSTKLRRSGCSSTCSQGKFGESQVRLVVYRAERISESCLTMISEQSGSSDVSVRRPNVPGGSGKPFGRGRAEGLRRRCQPTSWRGSMRSESQAWRRPRASPDAGEGSRRLIGESNLSLWRWPPDYEGWQKRGSLSFPLQTSACLEGGAMT